MVAWGLFYLLFLQGNIKYFINLRYNYLYKVGIVFLIVLLILGQ